MFPLSFLIIEDLFYSSLNLARKLKTFQSNACNKVDFKGEKTTARMLKTFQSNQCNKVDSKGEGKTRTGGGDTDRGP